MINASAPPPIRISQSSLTRNVPPIPLWTGSIDNIMSTRTNIDDQRHGLRPVVHRSRGISGDWAVDEVVARRLLEHCVDLDQ